MKTYFSKLRESWEAPDAISEVSIRVALVLCIFWTLFRVTPPEFLPQFLNRFSPESYNPVGLLYYLDIPFKISFFKFCYWGIFVFGSLVLLGFLRLISLPIFVFTSCCFFSLIESFYSWGWSHGFNIVLLALISYAALSFFYIPSYTIDRILIRLFFQKSKLLQKNAIPRFALILLQANVALMFLNAAFWKVNTSGLYWAYSDNMRNILAVQYPFIGRDLPGYLEIVVNNPFLYKGMAFGNLLLQCLPFFTIFALNPLIRLFGGILFCLTNLGLDIVMGLPTPSWYALAVVFIDWQWLFGKSQKLRKFISTPAFIHRPIFLYISTLLIWAVAFSPLIRPNFDKVTLNLYPLSAFPMYSDIKAQEPYRDKLPYIRNRLTFKVSNSCEDSSLVEEKLKRVFYGLLSTVDNDSEQVLRSAGDALCKYISVGYSCNPQIVIVKNISVVPPHPNPFKVYDVISGHVAHVDCEQKKTSAVFVKPIDGKIEVVSSDPNIL